MGTKNFNIMGAPRKIRFLKRGPWKTNMLKKWGMDCLQIKEGAWEKKRGDVFEGARYTNPHFDDKSFLSIFPKMPSNIFCSKICWQNSAKASLMYRQWTATVLIFLKVSTTDYLVFFSEYISRTGILTQASVITCK